MPTFADDLLEELRPQISSGVMKVDPDWRPYVRLIESRYPLVGSKIDWTRVPGSVQEIQSLQDPLGQSLSFMERQLIRNVVSDDAAVAIIGDSAVECVFLTTVGCFREVAPVFLELPQHLYLIPEDAAWCMVLTMEGDMCFGEAPATSDQERLTSGRG